MSYPRRFLPSMSLLTAFEAVIRTGSAAEAARDLALTQGTVSRLVQSLEAQLGLTLFRRERKRLVPTGAARAYAGEIGPALERVARATAELQSGAGGGNLTLAILPTFGTHWLAPRLPGFLAAHPGITIHLATRLRPFDFDASGIDAAIHFGTETWPRAGYLRLDDERVVPVASPAVAPSPEGGVTSVDELLARPLLSLESRPNGWRNWLRGAGHDAPVPRGMVFDQFGTMMQAAISGLGVALLPDFLAAPALADGRLVALAPPRVTSAAGYFLVWPLARADLAPLAAFRAWLADEVAQAARKVA